MDLPTAVRIVIEDVVDVLVARGALALRELPQVVQERLAGHCAPWEKLKPRA